MKNKTQNILIMSVTALLIILVIVWFAVLNKGSVAVTAGIMDYSITINNELVSCATDPCLIKLKMGTYGLLFQKNGYNSISAKVEVARWKATPVILSPKKKVEIAPSIIVPKIEADTPKIIPADLNTEDIISPTWHTDGRILFLDKSDERLKIRNLDGEIRLVTIFKNITLPINFYWSPNGAHILASQKGDIYFVDVDEGARKKQILEFAPVGISWSPKSDYILADNGSNGIYKIDWNNREPVKLEYGFKLNQSEWIDDFTLLIYSLDSKNNKTTIWTLDPLSAVTEILVEKYDFPIDKMVYDKEAGKAYLRNSQKNEWSEIFLQ